MNQRIEVPLVYRVENFRKSFQKEKSKHLDRKVELMSDITRKIQSLEGSQHPISSGCH